MDFLGIGRAWGLLSKDAKGESSVPGVLLTVNKAQSGTGYFVHVNSMGTNPAYPEKGEIDLLGFSKATNGPSRYEQGFHLLSGDSHFSRFELKENSGKLNLVAYIRDPEGKETVHAELRVQSEGQRVNTNPLPRGSMIREVGDHPQPSGVQ